MKIFLKLLLIIMISAAFFLIFAVNCSAETMQPAIDEFGGEELYDNVPDDVKTLFEKLGIDELSFDSIFNVTAKDIVGLIKNLVTGSVESPLKSTVRLIAVIIILAVGESFIPEETKVSAVVELVGVLLCIMSIINPITNAVKLAVASITISEKFMLVLIPILTAVISVSGNPTLALSFQSIAFVAAQIISAVASKTLVPVIGLILALDISGSMMPKLTLSGITEAVKKTITFLLSFSATIFVSFLGLKAGLANSADSLATKGMKLVISSAVPVVGGALSEAYSGLISSMILIKSTIGVFGICTVALITLPSCIQLLFWIFALRLSSGIAMMFEQNNVAGLLKSISSSLVLLNVIIVFVAVLFIISISLILILKAS